MNGPGSAPRWPRNAPRKTGWGGPTASAPPPPTVPVAKPVTRTIVDRDEYVGRFVAVYAVEVRARVSGYLDKVQFQDGQIVKQGDLLFTIDKRPFQNTLDQARANLELAKSNVVFAQSDLARGQQLLRDRTIREQIFEQRSQAARNAQAAVTANEAMARPRSCWRDIFAILKTLSSIEASA